MSDSATDAGAAPIEAALSLTELRTFQGAGELVRDAVKNGHAAVAPREVGDHGLAFLVPYGYEVTTVNITDFEDEDRLATFRTCSAKFVGVDSLARYVARYQTDDTLAYIRDVYGRGAAMLKSDTDAATVIIDDHPMNLDSPAAKGSQDMLFGDAEGPVGRRAHTAVLVLRPTAAAQRWGAVLGGAIDQETFLNLVDDGIGEIAAPDAAVLRDLISDLHAIRNSEVKSVVRTGGQGAIQVNENVSLHAGTGTLVEFPERMTIVLQPFAAIPSRVTLELRVAPKVAPDGKVKFTLSCATLDDKLAEILGDVAADIAERTGLNPHWQP